MKSVLNPAHMQDVPIAAEERLLRELARINFISLSDKPYPLKGGGHSRVYVNGRSELTDEPAVLARVGYLIARAAHSTLPHNVATTGVRPCLIGIPTAGTALAIAAGQSSENCGAYRCPVRIMREKPKDYGNSRGWVEGVPLPDQHRYVSVDNVITDGASKFEIIERLKADGYPTDDMVHIVLVDRQQGGVERLREAGLRVEVVFKLLDLVHAFGDLKLWPTDHVRLVEDELAAHV